MRIVYAEGWGFEFRRALYYWRKLEAGYNKRRYMLDRTDDILKQDIDGTYRTNSKGELERVTYNYGYYVALPGFELQVNAAMVDEASLEKLLLAYVEIAKWKAKETIELVFAGAWTNDGVIYLDLSEWTASREYALYLAKMRGQLAVWDCANKESVYVKE